MKIICDEIVLRECKGIMPEFFRRIENNEIYCYDAAGFTKDLTDEQKAKIEQMERDWKVKVVAVIESFPVFPGEDACHMLAYVYMEDNEDLCWVIEDDCVGFMANVINDTWDIEEYGSIGLVEKVGRVFRKY